MEKLYELKKKLCKQLEEYADKDLTSNILEVVDKLTHTIKNLDKIIAKYEEKENVNSFNNSFGTSYAMPNYVYDMNAGGGSFARGRSGGRRDSMGRYSNGYSRNGDIIMELTDLMEDAPDEMSRMEIQKLIKKMRNM